jgi:Methyltransferase domain
LSEDVVWCCRNLLGREPVLDEIVEFQQKTADFKQLVMDCVRSPEFADRFTRNHSPHDEGALSLPSILNRLSIEVDATEDELDKCASKIKTTWEYLGAEKAHWSVLATDTFLPDKLHASIDSFWASGQGEADLATHVFGQFGGSEFAQKVCVEFGCGVGRLTVGLAKSYKVVHAYDISRTHLAYAKARADEVGASNIEFHECSSDFRGAIALAIFFTP